MTHLKKFNEYDTWAGSLLAYTNPLVKEYPTTYPIPTKKANPYTCIDCGMEYYFIDEDGEPVCPNPNCKSKNYEPGFSERFSLNEADNIKKFNESISTQDLKDICLELEDIGMVVIVSNWYIDAVCEVSNDRTIGGLEIYKFVYWKDIKDCILRLKNYLGNAFISFAYNTLNKDNTRLSDNLSLKLSENSIPVSDKIFMFNMRYNHHMIKENVIKFKKCI